MQVEKVWFTFSSIALAFAFIFGNSIRTIYESVVFLFIVHPFDVGDGILLGVSQDYLVVRRCRHLSFALSSGHYFACQWMHPRPNCLFFNNGFLHFKHTQWLRIGPPPCASFSASIDKCHQPC